MLYTAALLTFLFTYLHLHVLYESKNFTPRFSKTFPEGLGFLKLIFYQSVHRTVSLCIIMLNFMEISHTAAEIKRLSAFFK